jgi:hypothetical protein
MAGSSFLENNLLIQILFIFRLNYIKFRHFVKPRNVIGKNQTIPYKNNQIEMKRRIFLSLLFLSLLSCNSNKRSSLIYLFPKDKSQLVSIISDYGNNTRIIAVGKHDSKPKSDYIELDISQIDKIGDEIGICWNSNGNGWQLVNDGAEIVHSEIDTLKYIFKEKWEEDASGIPNTRYYHGESCYTFGMENYSEVYPKEAGIVERKE